MTLEGMQEVIQKMGQLDQKKMHFRDQVIFMMAYADFAEKVAPLIAKYVDGADVEHRMFDVAQMLKQIKDGIYEQERIDNGDI